MNIWFKFLHLSVSTPKVEGVSQTVGQKTPATLSDWKHSTKKIIDLYRFFNVKGQFLILIRILRNLSILE